MQFVGDAFVGEADELGERRVRTTGSAAWKLPESAATHPPDNPAPRKEKPGWTGGAKVTTQLSVYGVTPSTAKLRNVANLRPMAKLSCAAGELNHFCA